MWLLSLPIYSPHVDRYPSVTLSPMKVKSCLRRCIVARGRIELFLGVLPEQVPDFDPVSTASCGVL
jgi:hypothetical protein